MVGRAGKTFWFHCIIRVIGEVDLRWEDRTLSNRLIDQRLRCFSPWLDELIPLHIPEWKVEKEEDDDGDVDSLSLFYQRYDKRKQTLIHHESLAHSTHVDADVVHLLLTLHSTMKLVTYWASAALCRRNSSRTYWSPNWRSSSGKLRWRRRIVLYNLKTVRRCCWPKIFSYIEMNEHHSKRKMNVFVCLFVCLEFSSVEVLSAIIEERQETRQKKNEQNTTVQIQSVQWEKIGLKIDRPGWSSVGNVKVREVFHDIVADRCEDDWCNDRDRCS